MAVIGVEIALLKAASWPYSNSLKFCPGFTCSRSMEDNIRKKLNLHRVAAD